MLGLIVAEKEETANLVKTLKSKIIGFNGIKYYIGYLDNQQVVICFSGIGKVNAAIAATNMIINFNVDKIFNIGLCGSCKPAVKPGSILIADNVEYSDVDLTAFNYLLNQLPDEPMQYSIKNQYVEGLKALVENKIIGTIATADSVVSIKNVESFPSLANKNVLGFDMEAAAIAQVCNKTKTDFFCMKLVSDNLSYDESSKSQYNTNYKTLAKQIEKICLDVIKTYNK